MAAACTGRSAPAPAPIEARSGSPAPSAAPADYVRSCKTSVYGGLGHGWRDGEISLGPVTFIGLSGLESARPSRFAPNDGGDLGQKVLAVVRNGAPVTIRVEPAADVALLYNPKRFNHADSVSDGDPTITLKPCRPGESPFGVPAAGRNTQFNGAFLLSGPVCARIEVQVEGGPLLARSVGFARASCP
jgi:hypothetical protein